MVWLRHYQHNRDNFHEVRYLDNYELIGPAYVAYQITVKSYELLSTNNDFFTKLKAYHLR